MKNKTVRGKKAQTRGRHQKVNRVASVGTEVGPDACGGDRVLIARPWAGAVPASTEAVSAPTSGAGEASVALPPALSVTECGMAELVRYDGPTSQLLGIYNRVRSLKGRDDYRRALGIEIPEPLEAAVPTLAAVQALPLSPCVEVQTPTGRVRYKTPTPSVPSSPHSPVSNYTDTMPPLEHVGTVITEADISAAYQSVGLVRPDNSSPVAIARGVSDTSQDQAAQELECRETIASIVTAVDVEVVGDERKQLWLRQIARDPKYRDLVSYHARRPTSETSQQPEIKHLEAKTTTQPKPALSTVIEPLSSWFTPSEGPTILNGLFGSDKYKKLSRRNKQRRDRAEATRAMLAQGLEELDLTEEEIKEAAKDRQRAIASEVLSKENGDDIEIAYMHAALKEWQQLLLEQVIMEIGVSIPYDVNYRQMVYRKLLDKIKAEVPKNKANTDFQHMANIRKMARQGLAHSLRAYRSALLEYDGIMASDAAQRAYEIHHAHKSGRTAGGATVASWWNTTKEGALGLGSIFRASRKLPPPC